MTRQDGPTYEIYALHFGHHVHYPSYMFFWMVNPPLAAEQTLMTSSYYLWLIKGPDATVLFDAGCTAEAAEENKIEEYEDHATLLGRLGLNAGDVDAVILSHLDWDHFDGISFFNENMPDVYLHEAAFSWHVQVARRYEILRAFNLPSWEEVEKALKLLDTGRCHLVKGEHGDRVEIMPGLSVLRTDGHAVGHLALVVQTAKGPVVLAADSVYVYENLEMGWPVGLVRTSLTDALDVFPMVKEITAKGGFVVPGHYIRITERFPQVKDRIYQIA